MSGERHHLASLPHYVYQFLGVDGGCLYVGATSDIARRLGQHMRERSWWPEISNISVTTYPNLASALSAEAASIRELQPTYNSHFTDSPNTAEWTPERRARQREIALRVWQRKRTERAAS